MIIQDEHGASWEVAKGDPAWEYVSVLERARFTKKALFKSAILQGQLPVYDPYYVADWEHSELTSNQQLLAVECVKYLRKRGLV